MGLGQVKPKRFIAIVLALGLVVSFTSIVLAEDEMDELKEEVKELKNQVEDLKKKLEKTRASQAVVATSWFNFARFYDSYIRSTGPAFVPNEEWDEVRDMVLTIYGVEATPSYIGLDTETVDDEVAKERNLTVRRGALITNIYEDTPASGSELQEGDVILSVESVDGEKEKKVEYAYVFRGMIWSSAPGTNFKLRIMRNGGFKQVNVETEKVDY